MACWLRSFSLRCARDNASRSRSRCRSPDAAVDEKRRHQRRQRERASDGEEDVDLQQPGGHPAHRAEHQHTSVAVTRLLSDLSVREPPPNSLFRPRHPGTPGSRPADAGSTPAMFGAAPERAREISLATHHRRRRIAGEFGFGEAAEAQHFIDHQARRHFAVVDDNDAHVAAVTAWRRSPGTGAGRESAAIAPRTLAMPFTQGLAPGTRVSCGGTAALRAFLRAPRDTARRPCGTPRRPIRARPDSSEAAAAVTARPRRSSSASSS